MIAPMVRKKSKDKKPRDWYRKQAGVVQIAAEISAELSARVEAAMAREQRAKRIILTRALEAYCRQSEEDAAKEGA